MRADDAKPPLLPEAQRQLEHVWSRVVARRGSEAASALSSLRPFVRESWERAIASNVLPGLRRAPLVSSPDEIRELRETSPWLEVAETELARQAPLLEDSGHILTLFDADGRMVYADGDPAILEAMKEIHFMPGALWSEPAVGTNGPGTALALGRPVHVVGAEHFCVGWQAWHCAALPIRDPVSNDVVGAIDLSGPRERVHVLAPRLALAIGRAVEKAVEARSLQRQARLVAAFAEVTARYPSHPIVAVDASRRIVLSTPAVPAETLRAGFAAGAPDVLEEIVVHDDGQIAGACLILEPPPGLGRGCRHAAGPAATRYRMADVIGVDPRIVEARRVAAAAAGNDMPVFIVGESGSGKEVVAQAIHAAGARAEGPFVAVSCAAAAQGPLDAGKVEAADGGTLFLDEVMELGTVAQAALLRVLQDGEVTRMGSHRALPVDVRVIAATSRDVAKGLAAGTLRRDLFHRLNVLAIALPPLREREVDFEHLALDMLAKASLELGKPPVGISPEALAALRCHTWPGNLRELKNLARRLVAMLGGARVELDDLPVELRVAGSEPEDSAAVVRARLVAAIESTRTMAEAAARLGMDRSTLYRQLEKHGLKRKKTVSDR